MTSTSEHSNCCRTSTPSCRVPLLRTLFTKHEESSASDEPLAICAGSRSVTGAYRNRNEDRCVVNAEHDLFLVADGVGGHGGGMEASEILIRVLQDWLGQAAKQIGHEVDIIESMVANAVESARSEMTEAAEADPHFRHMAATMAFALIIDRTLYVTRVGDCRAYLLHRGRLKCLTTDQTFVQVAIEAGLLTREAARDHAWRHVVTNTIGVEPLDQPIEVDEFELSAGDRLLLCSDGLTDVVRDSELQQFLTLGCSPQETANALIDLALERDSHDNVTCIIVNLSGMKTM